MLLFCRSEAEAGDGLLHNLSEITNTPSWVLHLKEKAFSMIELEDFFEMKLAHPNKVFEQFKTVFSLRFRNCHNISYWEIFTICQVC